MSIAKIPKHWPMISVKIKQNAHQIHQYWYNPPKKMSISSGKVLICLRKKGPFPPGSALVLVHHAGRPAVLGQICPAISAEVLVSWWSFPNRDWLLGQKSDVTARSLSWRIKGKTYGTVFWNSWKTYQDMSFSDVQMIWPCSFSLAGFIILNVFHDLSGSHLNTTAKGTILPGCLRYLCV